MTFAAGPSPVWAGETPCRVARPIFTAQSGASKLAAKLARHEKIRILAIGSSSTEGIGATSPENSYPAQLEDDLTAAWKENVTVVNAGRGGETAIQTVERMEAALKADSFDLVIWQVGTNDALNGVDEEAFTRLVERGIAAAKDTATDMLLLDQQYFPSIKDPARYERFVRAVGAIGGSRNVPVISRYEPMKEWGIRSPQELRTMLSADGFHMGDRGYDCLAHSIAETIQSLVKQPISQARLRPPALGAGKSN